MKLLRSLVQLPFLFSFAFADETASIDALLDAFVHKSDLSNKTRIETAGNVITFTREELDTMQVRNLKDVLKSLPMLNYNENRWGITDPGYIRQTLPFNSNAIRVYIDNQEVTTASYGSGLFIIGDIDTGFVDHIEVYTLNPSFEYSTEPAKYLIKLYSKTAKRDKGTELELSFGSHNSNHESIQHADIKEDLSYYFYASRFDDRRKKYETSDAHKLSRDQERYHLFSTLSTNNQHLNFQAIKNDKDMNMGLSSDGSMEISNAEIDYLHLGYENSFVDNIKFDLMKKTSA